MKTYKDFRKDLEENNIIASAIDKYKQMKEKKNQEQSNKVGSGDKLDDDMKLDKPTSVQNQDIKRDAKKKPGQPPVTEEKEANAKNCSDLPPDEKKKERRMDIEKINKKIKPHHKKISAKK